MVHTKKGDKEMLSPEATDTPHSLAHEWQHSGFPTDSTISGGGDSIAAETIYFTAKCQNCSWCGNDYPNDSRPARDEAADHQIEFPGHSASVESKKAPT